MNRLTKRHNNGASWNGNPDHSTQVRYRELLDRLAEYEDTGLTPEEVAEMAKAKADGRLVVLPCKVGETVRVNVGGLDTPGQVMQVRHNQKHLKLIINCNGMRVDRYVDDFGKTVFLTREEAEAALRKEQWMNEKYGCYDE